MGSLGRLPIAKRTLIVLNHTRVLTSIVAVYHDVGFDFRCCTGYGSLPLWLYPGGSLSLYLAS